MEPMGDAWVKKFKTVKVKLKDGTIIIGKLNIGEYARVFDYFRSSPDQYFILSDAEHDEHGEHKMGFHETGLLKGCQYDHPDKSPGREQLAVGIERDEQSGKVVIINKNEIVWAEPATD